MSHAIETAIHSHLPHVERIVVHVEPAREIVANAPLAVQSVRATMRAGLVAGVQAATAHEYGEQHWLRQTKDHKEGLRAVAERRSGRFVGR